MKAKVPFGCVVAAVVFLAGCSTGSSTLPGTMADGRVRLPNGWLLSPAGTHVGVGELPLNMDVTPDGRYLIVTNNGTGVQSVSVIDADAWQVVQTLPLQDAWMGIRFFNGGREFAVSGGNDGTLHMYRFRGGRAASADTIVIGKAWPDQKIWLSGLDIDTAAAELYVGGELSDTLYAVDLNARRVAARLGLPGAPYTCLCSRHSSRLYVSLWDRAAIAVIDRPTLQLVRTIPVGDHPNDMTESPDGSRLFVANANQNTVSVIDASAGRVTETLSTSLFPGAPEGSTPNSVALSSDGRRLYVANADNNYVAVFDVTTPGEARSLGFIPVGWYPTCVRILPGRSQIAVACGKGLGSAANPDGPRPGRHVSADQYTGTMFKGVLSRIAEPSADDLLPMSAQVYANSLFTDRKASAPNPDIVNPIPGKVGDPSPIKHVFYVIKENRTYDQVFGDMGEGNGDPSLCLFTEKVTPNHHALAREFVLLDNFYADAEVSADGHSWSMGAYATDYVEKSWPTQYGGHGGEYTYEGGNEIVYPSAGYLWDNCGRHGVSYRTYGEFARNGATPADSCTATMPSLVGHVAPFYRGWDLGYSDVERVKSWMKEFSEYEENGDLPQFQILKLPNDHTEGTLKGSLSPRAYVAQNDLALGMIVDRISHSKYWKESAIFVIEDDAQNGPDHVDAHRTVALVISPYTKRHGVDSHLYSTSSMVRTMELILGLPPLSQFDAAAEPMYNSFTLEADVTPYTCRQAVADIHERNSAGAYGQQKSATFDFTREDATPERELNEIVWKSIRGRDSDMPSPVHSAFVRTAAEGEERARER